MFKLKKSHIPNYLSFLSIIVTIVVAYWAINVSESIAIKSGSYEKGEPILYLGQKEISKESETILAYGLSENTDSAVVLSRIPFAVSNKGSKNLINTSITIRYPQKLNLAVESEYLNLVTHGLVGDRKILREVQPFGDFMLMRLNIGDIQPKQGMIFDEPIHIFSSEVTDTVSVNAYKYSIYLRYSIPLQVTISADNIDPVDYKINLVVYNSNAMNQLIDKFINSMTDESKKLRSSYSFFQYLVLLLKTTEQNAVLIYPNLKKILLPGKKLIFIPASNSDEVALVRYDLFFFRYLF